MTEKTILFDRFAFPRLRGLRYLCDECAASAEYLFVNDPLDRFSLYFEQGMTCFSLPEEGEGETAYALTELVRPDRHIRLYCPACAPHLDSAMWYFSVELTDRKGNIACLPGQVRVSKAASPLLLSPDKPRFLEVLETVALREP